MNLRENVIRGLSWTLNGQLVIQLINFLTWIILARLLSPDDFGLVALLIVVTRLLALFRNVGLTEALIQHKSPSDQVISAVFWLHVFLGGIIALLLYAAGYLLVLFYEEPLILEFIGFIALEFFIGAFYLVPAALMNKTLKFKTLFIVEYVAVLFGAVLGITLAWLGYDLFFYAKWKPLFSFNFTKIKPLFKFSLPLLASQILRYFNRNLDDLLIGKELGTQSLGIYNRSYALMLLPLSHITNGAAKVLFPAFSILQEERAKIKTGYLKAARLIALLSFPLMVGLFVLSEDIINVILGNHWAEMVPIVRILALLGMFQSVSALNGTVFLALDATRLQLKIRIFSSISLAIFICFGVYYLGTIEGVATCYAIASCLIVFPIWHILAKLIGATLFDLIKNLGAVCLAAFGMGAFLLLLEQWSLAGQTWIDLSFRLLLGAACYYLLLLLFKVKALAEFKALIMERLKKLK